MTRLTLSDALASGRLDEFAKQAEADGIGPADGAQFDKIVGRVTAPRPEDQTSHSPAGDFNHLHFGHVEWLYSYW